MDGVINENVMKGVCICILATACITGTILLILGISSLEATEFGLDYSWISKTINPVVKENGLYFIGIGHSFIRFPKNVQTIDFSKENTASRPPVQSRTSDGLEVILEVSFQYTLQPENLFKLYSKYGAKYNQVFQNVAVDILTDEATKYTAYDFFMNRGSIKDDFQANLDTQFSKICYSNINFLQLRSVDLPDLFEQSIQDSEVKKQDIQKAQAELNKVRIEIDTRIKSALFQKDVTINKAEGEASALLQKNSAEVDSLKQVQNSQTEAYTNLKSNLNMTNTDLLSFIKTKVLKNYDGQNMALNIQSIETPTPANQ